MFAEYQIQMKVNGEWKHARYPDGRGWCSAQNPKDVETCKKGIEGMREAWRDNWCKNPKVPTDFRIVVRIVSEWASLE